MVTTLPVWAVGYHPRREYGGHSWLTQTTTLRWKRRTALTYTLNKRPGRDGSDLEGVLHTQAPGGTRSPSNIHPTKRRSFEYRATVVCWWNLSRPRQRHPSLITSRAWAVLGCGTTWYWPKNLIGLEKQCNQVH